MPGRVRSGLDLTFCPPLFDVEKAVDSVHRLRALQPAVIFVFGYNEASYSPDKTLQWAEEDVLAVERIVLEGMKQKLSSREIGQRIDEYYSAERLVRQEQQYVGSEEAMAASGPPLGMVAYLKRKYPDLEMPQ